MKILNIRFLSLYSLYKRGANIPSWCYVFIKKMNYKNNFVKNLNSINNLSVEDKDIIVNEISLIILIDGGLGGIDSGK